MCRTTGRLHITLMRIVDLVSPISKGVLKMHFAYEVKLRNVVRTEGTTRTESIVARVHCTAL